MAAKGKSKRRRRIMSDGDIERLISDCKAIIKDYQDGIQKNKVLIQIEDLEKRLNK